MNRLSVIGLACALLWAAAPALAAVDVERACTHAVLAYGDAWDHGDGSKFANLFTEDAVLDLGTGPAKGKAAIAELFAKRNPTSSTRHVMTNIQITAQEGGRAEGLSYLTLFAGPPRLPTTT